MLADLHWSNSRLQHGSIEWKVGPEGHLLAAQQTAAKYLERTAKSDDIVCFPRLSLVPQSNETINQRILPPPFPSYNSQYLGKGAKKGLILFFCEQIFHQFYHRKVLLEDKLSK